MIGNVPPVLQTTWDKVAGDGNINKADVDALKAAAGNSADPQVKSFISDIETRVKDKQSVDVKNGTAKGSFDFVEATTPIKDNSPQIKILEEAKVVALKDPETAKQVPAIDKEIARLKAGGEPTQVKADPKEQVKEAPKVDKVGEQIKILEEAKVVALKDPETAKQVPAIDKEIARLKKDHFMGTANDIIQNAGSRDFNTLEGDKTKLNGEYDGLPKDVQENKEVKETKDTANAALYTNSKKELFNEINKIIDTCVTDVLKTGDKSKFTEAKNKIEELVGKYKGLDDDPVYKKIKAILSGAPEAESIKISADNKVMAAAKMVDQGNAILSSPKFGRAEKRQAEDFSSKLPEGDFKTKLQDKLKGYAATQETIHNENIGKTEEAIHDILKKPFLGIGGGAKEDTAKTLMKDLASEKPENFEKLMRRLSLEEQERAVKILLKDPNDQEAIDLGKKLYTRIAAVSNFDDKFNKDQLGILQKPVKEDKKEVEGEKDVKNEKPVTPQKKVFNDKQINEYGKSLSYAVRNENKVALTMTRAILEGKAPEASLTKLSKNDLADLIDIVGKEGRPGEKEDLLDLVGQSPVPLNFGKFDADTKSKLLKQFMDNDKFDEKELPKQLNNYEKKDIYKAVNSGTLSDKQLATIAKYSDGDKMSDDPKIGGILLRAMINDFVNNNDSTISHKDIMKFLDGVSSDADSKKVAIKVMDDLGDGPASVYAKLKQKDPYLLDRLWEIRR
ncbi:MAG: hypothetical protein AABZ74_01315 [Cyanobacteriota bacterium]